MMATYEYNRTIKRIIDECRQRLNFAGREASVSLLASFVDPRVMLGESCLWTLIDETETARLFVLTSPSRIAFSPDIETLTRDHGLTLSDGLRRLCSQFSIGKAACRHEWVNAGFRQIVMVCKHCDLEKPE